jgi:hypothetical protein
LSLGEEREGKGEGREERGERREERGERREGRGEMRDEVVKYGVQVSFKFCIGGNGPTAETPIE